MCADGGVGKDRDHLGLHFEHASRDVEVLHLTVFLLHPDLARLQAGDEGGVTGSEVEDYHDWEVMLGKLGMLSWDHAVGRFFFVVGGITMAAAVLFGAVSTWREARRG